MPIRLMVVPMLLATDAIARSLRGSWRLMSSGETALAEIDLTTEGLLRSLCAASLTLPAMICVLAAEQSVAGLSNAAGLFQSLPLVLAVLCAQIAAFLCVPALLVGLAPALLRDTAFSRFVIAWNWTEILSASLMAVPAIVFAVGWSTPVIAAVHWLAFAAIVARLRYAAARATLGSAPWLAGLVVCASFLCQLAVTRLLGLWGF